MAKRPSDLRPEWDALKQEAVALAAEDKVLQGLPPTDPKVAAQEAGVAMLDAKKELLATAAWVGEARDLPDLLLLAELVWDLNWGVGTFPEFPADIDDRSQQEVAVAYLVRGVFTASQAIADGRNS